MAAILLASILASTLSLLLIILVVNAMCLQFFSTRLSRDDSAFGIREETALPDVGPQLEHNQTRSLLEILKSSVCFASFEKTELARLAECFETVEIEQGSAFPSIAEYSLAYVLQGKLILRYIVPRQHSRIRGGIGENLKIILAGQSIVPSLQTLAHIVSLYTDDHASHGNEGDLMLSLQASQKTSIAVLRVEAFHQRLKESHNQSLHLIDAIIRRLYFSTFAVAQHYMNANEEIAAYVRKLIEMTSLSKDDRVFWHNHMPQVGLDEPPDISSSLKVSAGPEDDKEWSSSPSSKRPGQIPHEHSPDGRSARLRILQLQIPHKARSPVSHGTASPTPLTALSRIEALLPYPKSRFMAIHAQKAASLTSAAVRQTVTSLMLRSLQWSRPLKASDPVWLEHRQLFSEHDSALGELTTFAKSSILISQGKRLPGLFILIDGVLEGRFRDHSEPHTEECTQPAVRITPGDIFGFDCILPNNRALMDVVALTDVHVAMIPRTEVHDVALAYPPASIKMAKQILSSLWPATRLADAVLDVTQLGAGDFLQNPTMDSQYFVQSGRLRLGQRKHAQSNAHQPEVGSGQSFGALDRWLEPKQFDPVRAIRKSALSHIQLMSLEAMSANVPSLALQFVRKALQLPGHSNTETPQSTVFERPQSSIRTVALVVITPELIAERYASRLVSSIEALGVLGQDRVTSLHLRNLRRSLGDETGAQLGKALLDNYLAQVEEGAAFVMYVANLVQEKEWARTCIDHADLVVFVASSTSHPAPSEAERQLAEVGVVARSTLLLIHSGPQGSDTGTPAQWLDARPWLDGEVHHAFMINDQRVWAHSGSDPTIVNRNFDFDRFARRIFGKSIALVLGGGGARGIAHLAVLKALEERSIPVDIVGGCSIGSFVGAVYARDPHFQSTYDITRRLCRKLAVWRQLADITWPWIAITSGARFNSLMKEVFHKTDLADTWLSFYCAVTNLNRQGRTQILTSGSAWKSIRASMSFLGFVPPIADRNGDLLLDGCFSTNLPVSYAAQNLKPELILAVDVGPDMDFPKYPARDHYSSWHMLWRRFWPKDTDMRAHSWMQEALTYSNSLADIEVTKAMPICQYTKMPLGGYAAHHFHEFDEIFDIGYAHAVEWLDELERKGVLDSLAIRRTPAVDGSKP